MSWQDVRHHYESREDEPEPPPVEGIDTACQLCGNVYRCAADSPDYFCSVECERQADEQRAADYHAAYDAAMRAERAGMVTKECAACSKPFLSRQDDYADLCCSTTCWWNAIERDSEMWDCGGWGEDDLPI